MTENKEPSTNLGKLYGIFTPYVQDCYEIWKKGEATLDQIASDCTFFLQGRGHNVRVNHQHLKGLKEIDPTLDFSFTIKPSAKSQVESYAETLYALTSAVCALIKHSGLNTNRPEIIQLQKKFDKLTATSRKSVK